MLVKVNKNAYLCVVEIQKVYMVAPVAPICTIKKKSNRVLSLLR